MRPIAPPPSTTRRTNDLSVAPVWRRYKALQAPRRPARPRGAWSAIRPITLHAYGEAGGRYFRIPAGAGLGWRLAARAAGALEPFCGATLAKVRVSPDTGAAEMALSVSSSRLRI